MTAEDTICPACGSVNGYTDSFLGYAEHHRCRWCGAQYFVDQIEEDFLLDCSMPDLIPLIEEDTNSGF